jgi:hypothetical protein
MTTFTKLRPCRRSFLVATREKHTSLARPAENRAKDDDARQPLKNSKIEKKARQKSKERPWRKRRLQLYCCRSCWLACAVGAHHVGRIMIFAQGHLRFQGYGRKRAHGSGTSLPHRTNAQRLALNAKSGTHLVSSLFSIYRLYEKPSDSMSNELPANLKRKVKAKRVALGHVVPKAVRVKGCKYD